MRLTVEFSDATVKEHEKMTTNRYLTVAKIPGFRPGKAPLTMIRDKYKDEIQKDVVSHLLEAGLQEAIEKTKLMPVNRPQIELGELALGSGKPFEFHAEFEVQPEIELRSYKGVPLQEAPIEATNEEVKKTLDNLRDRFSVLEPLESKKAEKGNLAVVEFAFEVTGNPEKKQPAQNITVEVGAGRLLPELDAALEGLEIGESKKVVAKFPEDYDEKSLAGKEATFDCKLLELKKKTLPELNDAFAEQLKVGTTLEALNQEIRENILRSKRDDVQRNQRQEIIDYLIKNNQFDVPSSLVQQQAQSLMQWMDSDLKKRGMSVSQLKQDELESVQIRAENMVRSSLLLKEIAQKEKIELDEDKLQERVDAVATQLNRSAAETRNFLEGKGMIDRLRDEVLTDQVFDFLLKNAKLQGAPSPKA